jgi:diguanylate cyclase (GGDEF)-like protein
VQSRTLAGLCRITERLARPGSVPERVQDALEITLELLGADHGSVRVCEPPGMLTPIARAGVGTQTPASVYRDGEGLLGWAVKTARVVRVADTLEDARFAHGESTGYAVRSLVSIPLMVGKRVLGVLSVSSATPGVFDVSHELLAITIGQGIAQAIRIAELERQATTDAMTRAFNRSQLLPTLQAEINRARRQGSALSVLLMDLDHFKSVNDRFGHAVGDAVLCSFADIVRASVRSFDVLIRRGGEEFELVMPSTGLADGLTVAERIRTRLASEPLRFGDGIELHQTVSIGLATWDGHEGAASVDHRADLAMYAAKRSGRNRVLVAPEPRLPADLPVRAVSSDRVQVG